MTDKSKLGPSPIPRDLVVVALLVVILWGAAQARSFLIPVCIAALLAFLMAPMVAQLRKWKVPEILAIGISALVLVLPFLLIGYLLGHEISLLVRDFPRIRAWFDLKLLQLAHSQFGERFDIPEVWDLSGVVEKLVGSIGESVHVALKGVQTLLEFGSHLALVLLFAVVMLATRHHLSRSAQNLIAQYEGASSVLLDEVVLLIERFLVARLVIVLVAGTLGTVALWIFGVPYTLVLGMAMGVGTLIPVVGYFSGVVLSVAVALATGHTLGTIALLIVTLAAVGVFESHVLTPKYIGVRLNINVLFTFLGLFAGELLWGLWGMFLSIPFLGILRIAFSASSSMKPWGELLAEREDKGFQERLSKKRLK